MHRFDIWNHQIKLGGIKWFMVKMPFWSACYSQVAGNKCVNALMQETYGKTMNIQRWMEQHWHSFEVVDECRVMMFNIHGLVNVEYLWETHFVLQLWKQQETKKKKREKKQRFRYWWLFISALSVWFKFSLKRVFRGIWKPDATFRD